MFPTGNAKHIHTFELITPKFPSSNQNIYMGFNGCLYLLIIGSEQQGLCRKGGESGLHGFLPHAERVSKKHIYKDLVCQGTGISSFMMENETVLIQISFTDQLKSLTN